MKKSCFKCGQNLSITEFYKHPKMPDGHVNKCKSCTKEDLKKNYNKKIKDPDWVKKERNRGRMKYHKLYKNTKQKNVKKLNYNSLYRKKYPEKYYAKTKSQKIKILLEEKHHWSYNEEHYCDVIHMTRKDHAKAHRFLIYDQERMMYRTINGVLLDTKETHEKYIYDKIKNEED